MNEDFVKMLEANFEIIKDFSDTQKKIVEVLVLINEQLSKLTTLIMQGK